MRRVGRFFLYLFASIGALITLSITAMIVFAVTFGDEKPDLPEQIVLRLNLDSGVSDSRSDDPWRELRGDKTNYLYEIVTKLAVAETDDRVVGLAIRLGASRISLAHAQELRASIASFRSRGKFVMAFAQTFGSLGNATTEYYLASSADEIWMQPSGQLALLGIGMETPFLKDALYKVGVTPEFQQRHEYKSAIELLTRNDMSTPARKSLLRVVGSWMDQIVSGIAADRNLTSEVVRQLVDRSPLLAEEAKTAKLVDRFGYWDAFTQALKARVGADAVELAFANYDKELEAPETAGTDVALIYGVGPIQSGDADNNPFDSEIFAAGSVGKAIDAAVDDKSIEAIILRIDSPGGSYIGSSTVRRAVVRAKEKGKPVIATMGKYGASGGYFVAMGADKVVALPGTLTGSIGVFGSKIATVNLWSNLGIHWSRVGVCAHAGMWSQVFPFSPTAAARHRAIIDFVYEDFTKKTASDRAFPDGHIDAVARGRIWTGEGAQRVGLIDKLGGYTAAVGLVRETLKLEADAPLNIVGLPEPKTPIERVREAFSGGVPFMQAVAELLSGPRPDSLSTVLRHLEPVVGDTSFLRPPAGLLQLPSFRLAP